MRVIPTLDVSRQLHPCPAIARFRIRSITATDLAALGWARHPEAERREPDAICAERVGGEGSSGRRRRSCLGRLLRLGNRRAAVDTQTREFRVAAIVPIDGAAADRDLVPEYPGITDSDRVADWDPPFPIDLKRVRPVDEEYWDRYRATPKAFIPIERGQAAVGLASWRADGAAPGSAAGMSLDDGARAIRERAAGRARSAGARVFGATTCARRASPHRPARPTLASTSRISAPSSSCRRCCSAGLFFKLGVEQRLQEIGLLQALGFDPAAIRRLFVGEAIVLVGDRRSRRHGGRVAYALADHAGAAHLVG